MANGYRWEIGQPTSIISWLVGAKVLPEGRYKRKNRLPNTNLDPDAISLSYLAEVATEWDEDGDSMPHEFVRALKFECNGTKEKGIVGKVLNDLSAEGEEWQSFSSAFVWA